MKIRVFSLEEFSVYDGPGIRTTVFFKGCPLHCNWCHSPEGQDYAIIAVRSPNGCLHCGKCVEVCPYHREKCVACGKCLEVCPRNLIRFSGQDYETEDLAKILLKNADLLLENNGGITFSGGEPLLQADALNELIHFLKGKVHLALQTSGYAPSEKFQMIAQQMDLLLFDMKIMDPVLAEKMEGKDPTPIFTNLDYVRQKSLPVIIRIPLIPGVIDTEENLQAIIDKIKDLPGLIRVELMPYNKFAGAKYPLAGKRWAPLYDESCPSKPHLELFEKAGIPARLL
jgi:pyruvate formate lyase activating enzyme